MSTPKPLVPMPITARWMSAAGGDCRILDVEDGRA
jgi:hypothetical protein